MSGLSARVAARLCVKAEHPLPVGAAQAAKVRLLHGIGVNLISSRLDAATVAWHTVEDEAGDCTVIGRGKQLTESAAAFANSVAAHNSLLEDCGPGGLREGSHPSTYVLPAALAAAEHRGATGRELLTAIIVGYEAVGLLGTVSPTSIVARRFRPLGVMGPIGAAAAAAVIYGCDEQEMAAALSVAANCAAGFGQGFVAGSMEPYLHAGFASRNGLLAARLARTGVTVSYDAFEGPYGFFETYGGEGVQEATDETAYAVERVGTKRFAACLQNQESLTLISEQLPVPFDVAEIARVRLFRPATPNNGTASPGVGSAPPYRTMLQRQMSARFTAAAALLDRDVDDVRYFHEAADDEPVERVSALVELIATDEASVRVEVDTVDGRTLSAAGDRSAILYPTSEEIRSRFRSRAATVLGEASELVEPLVDKLEELDDVRTLSKLLRPSGTSVASY